MPITENTIYEVDALALLEHMEDGTADLVFLDPLWISGGESDRDKPANEAAQVRASHVRELTRVIEQVLRVLSDRGTLFYFSNPGMAGQMRVILDRVFGEANFRSEFVWARRNRRTNSSRQPRHDTILWYGKSEHATENQVRRPLKELEGKYFKNQADEKGPFRAVTLEAASNRPHLTFSWRGHVPGPGRSWRYDFERNCSPPPRWGRFGSGLRWAA